MEHDNNDFFEQEIFDNQFIESDEIFNEPEITSEPVEEIKSEEGEEEIIETPQDDIIEGEEDIPTTVKDVKLEIKGNPLVLFAKKWQEDGKLPEDFEITEDISEEDIDIALYNYKDNKERGFIKEEVLRELSEKEGLNEDVISTAKKLHFGVTEEHVKREQIYNYLATVKLDPDNESFENDTLSIGIEFYIDKDFTKEMAERYATRDIEDDPEESLSMYQQHFVKKAVDQRQINDEIVRQKQEDIEKANLIKSEKIKKFFENGKILNREYSKEEVNFLQNAIYKKDQVYTDPNTGVKKRVSLEQKKILESRGDFDKYLKARFDFILGYDLNKIEGVSETKAKNKILKELGSMIKVQTVDKNSGGGNQNKSRVREDEELLF